MFRQNHKSVLEVLWGISALLAHDADLPSLLPSRRAFPCERDGVRLHLSAEKANAWDIARRQACLGRVPLRDGEAKRQHGSAGHEVGRAALEPDPQHKAGNTAGRAGPPRQGLEAGHEADAEKPGASPEHLGQTRRGGKGDVEFDRDSPRAWRSADFDETHVLAQGQALRTDLATERLAALRPYCTSRRQILDRRVVRTESDDDRGVAGILQLEAKASAPVLLDGSQPHSRHGAQLPWCPCGRLICGEPQLVDDASGIVFAEVDLLSALHQLAIDGPRDALFSGVYPILHDRLERAFAQIEYILQVLGPQGLV